MKKIEIIWHHLLTSALNDHQYQHTQAGIAASFHYSTSTVHAALTRPTALGAIRKSGKFFVLADPTKLLYFWATNRNLARDTLYHTTSPLSVRELESLIPPTAAYGGYSAATRLLDSPPADYTHIFFYLPTQDLTSAKSRFPHASSGPTQLTILKTPPQLGFFNSLTSLPLTFVDLWGQPDWYAADFTKSLGDKFHALLS